MQIHKLGILGGPWVRVHSSMKGTWTASLLRADFTAREQLSPGTAATEPALWSLESRGD